MAPDAESKRQVHRHRVVQQEKNSSSDSEALKLTTPAATLIEVIVQIEKKLDNKIMEVDARAAVSETILDIRVSKT